MTQEAAQEVLKVIQVWSSQVLGLAVVLAAIGTITMALLELAKAVIFARLLFHKLMIRQWIGPGQGQALEQLLGLAAGGTAGANGWYNQPDDRLVATLQAAANVALNYPCSYPAIYEFLVGNSNAGDSQLWCDASKLATTPVPPHEKERAELLAKSRKGNEARLRLANFVQRKIDTLANQLDWKWARLNQSIALIVGAIMTFFFLSPHEITEHVGLTGRIMFSILGGLIAPFAKDVVSALSGIGTAKT